jgi:hypothetical protein
LKDNNKTIHKDHLDHFTKTIFEYGSVLKIVPEVYSESHFHPIQTTLDQIVKLVTVSEIIYDEKAISNYFKLVDVAISCKKLEYYQI